LLAFRGRLQAAGGGATAQTRPVVKILELVPGRCDTLPLPAGTLKVPGPGGTGASTLPVTLSRTEYSCRYSIARGGAPRERSDRISCYELGDGAAYHWALWRGSSCGNWSLFACGPGANYLACAAFTFIVFAEVSKPRGREDALIAVLSSAGVPDPATVEVPVLECVPEVREWGRDAFYRDIRTRAIRSLGPDAWEVKFSNPDGSQVYTMVKDGPNTKWRLK
jgi:hypothetical protein